MIGRSPARQGIISPVGDAGYSFIDPVIPAQSEGPMIGFLIAIVLVSSLITKVTIAAEPDRIAVRSQAWQKVLDRTPFAFNESRPQFPSAVGDTMAKSRSDYPSAREE